MPRRLHAARLAPGLVDLDDGQSRHAQRVLRLQGGDRVELFDDAGRSAAGTVVVGEDGRLRVQVGDVREPATGGFELVVAAAVPKGERADWMVEKLSELGCGAFVPLVAERSVVQPKGTGKLDRWARIATESAKQCRRAGVMRVDPPTPLYLVLAGVHDAGGRGWFLDTGPTAVSVRLMVESPRPAGRLTLFVGPEGGWTAGEVDRMLDARVSGVGLTRTVLRVETAAVAAAAVVAAMWAGGEG